MHPISQLLVFGFSLSFVGSALSSAQAETAIVPPATQITPETTEADKKKPEKEVTVLGWKEWIWVVKPELVMRAKLDTGAHTSSIHATNIEQIELDGKKWVRFTIYNHNDKKGIRVRHKAPLARVSKVKNDSGGIDERYVVPLVFQIGNRKLEGEFNLNDREKMTCSVLIGRNILMQLGVVDSGKTDLLPKPKFIKPRETKPDKEEVVAPLDQK